MQVVAGMIAAILKRFFTWTNRREDTSVKTQRRKNIFLES